MDRWIGAILLIGVFDRYLWDRYLWTHSDLCVFLSSGIFFFSFCLEEITAKDHALVKEHFDHAKVEKEKEGLRNELSKMKKLLEDNSETIDSQNQELIKLTSMIQKMDAMAIQQRNEYEQVINERDILGKACLVFDAASFAFFCLWWHSLFSRICFQGFVERVV